MALVAPSIVGRMTLAVYLGRRFAFHLVAVFSACIVLIFIIDSVENIRRGASHDVGIGTVLLLSLYRLPSLSELVLPFAVLFAAMMTFLMLTRSLELVVARSAGVSVWQFIAPVLLVALTVGVLATTLYNPLAANLKARHEVLHAASFGGASSPLGSAADEIWLRQRGVDGPSVMHARASSDRGVRLVGVMVLAYTDDLVFRERIDAERAVLEEGRWRLTNAWVMSPGQDPELHQTYLLSTHLSRTQVQESLAAAETISFWNLPESIQTADRAGLPAIQYRLQFHSLLARPLLLCAMVLIAATVSLRLFRFGNVGALILGGIVAGFVLYVISKLGIDLGKAGAVPPFVAAWAPAIVGSLLGMTVLLFQEDG
jgi:lipopolysaccharide export system permease protein